MLVTKYHTTAPQLATWLEANVPEGLTLFALPPEHRRRLRTSNPRERLNEEIKRRIRVIRTPPDRSFPRLKTTPDQSAQFLGSTAVLQETSEDWDTGKVYLAIETN